MVIVIHQSFKILEPVYTLHHQPPPVPRPLSPTCHISPVRRPTRFRTAASLFSLPRGHWAAGANLAELIESPRRRVLAHQPNRQPRQGRQAGSKPRLPRALRPSRPTLRLAAIRRPNPTRIRVDPSSFRPKEKPSALFSLPELVIIALLPSLNPAFPVSPLLPNETDRVM